MHNKLSASGSAPEADISIVETMEECEHSTEYNNGASNPRNEGQNPATFSLPVEDISDPVLN